MARLADYTSGTITLTNGEAEFTGTGTAWLIAMIREGDTILDLPGTAFQGVIASIEDNVSGTLTQPWAGPTLEGVPYRVRYLPDGARGPALAALVRELLAEGNVQALAALAGLNGRIPIFTGPGAMSTIARTDLVSGVAFNVQVADLAARATYDAQPAGFAVLVADIGDGRAAVYSKASEVVADWTDPAFVTGPPITLTVTDVEATPFGEEPEFDLISRPGGYNVEVKLPSGMILQPGTVTTLDAGDPAEVDFVPITGGFRIDMGIPRGPTGTIDGVTTFWQDRITFDMSLAAAQAGLEIVTEVHQDTGIIIDDADPRRPIVSLDIADQPTAEAGTDNEKAMTALRVKQAIDALTPPGYPATARRNQLLSFGRLAKLMGGFWRGLDTVAFGFSVAGEADAGSTGGAVDTVAKAWKPGITAGAARFPVNMTSNTAPSPYVASSGSVFSPNLPYLAFDGNAATYWQNNTSMSPDYLQIDLGAGNATTVASYQVQASSGAAPQAPRDFNLQGSNDGSGFTTVDSRTGQSFTGGETKTFTLGAVSAAYRYWRLQVTANSASSANFIVASFQAYGPGTPNNATWIAPYQTADATRSKARAVLEIDPIDAITLGTDWTVELTCNGGTTWNAAALANVGNGQAGRTVIETNEVACTPGTSYSARVRNLNNKMVHIHSATIEAAA